MNFIPHDKAVLKIAVLCCDIPAGRRALKTLRNLASQEEPAIHVHPSVWYIDSLHERNMARAVADGIAADHIMVAASSRQLPMVAEQWLAAVLAKRGRPTQVIGWWGGSTEWSALQMQTPATVGDDSRASNSIAAAA